ncbi:MAG: sensor histidine kinase [bacterium]|jgi:two-component system NarL family sensor kinase
MSTGEKELVYIILLSSIIILGFIVLVLIVLGQIKRRIKKSALEINTLKIIHEKELLKTKLEIQEETFKKISREIHDNISLGLTLSKLQITNYLEKQPDVNQLLSTSIDLIAKSLVDLNDISKSLDGNQLISHGLINALESEISVLSRSGIYKIELEVMGEPVYLDAETDLVLLRIFQEAMNNILKHAKANYITIDLTYNQESMIMKIADNGKGFDPKKVQHNKEIRKMSGLNNFYTRAAVIGATVNIISYESIGTTIIIETPLKKQQ